jgi:uncharacterized protein
MYPLGSESTVSRFHGYIHKVEQNTGNKVVLLEGVEVVTAGVARIIELQEQGYSYIRP